MKIRIPKKLVVGCLILFGIVAFLIITGILYQNYKTESNTVATLPAVTQPATEAPTELITENLIKSNYTLKRIISTSQIVLKNKDNTITAQLIGVKSPQNSSSLSKTGIDFLTQCLKNKNISIRYDINKTTNDGKSLVYVYYDNDNGEMELLNYTLIYNGYCTYTKDNKNTECAKMLNYAMRNAKDNKRGVWSDKISSADSGGLK